MQFYAPHDYISQDVVTYKNNKKIFFNEIVCRDIITEKSTNKTSTGMVSSLSCFGKKTKYHFRH